MLSATEYFLHTGPLAKLSHPQRDLIPSDTVAVLFAERFLLFGSAARANEQFI
jgi:hypothetical protein